MLKLVVGIYLEEAGKVARVPYRKQTTVNRVPAYDGAGNPICESYYTEVFEGFGGRFVLSDWQKGSPGVESLDTLRGRLSPAGLELFEYEGKPYAGVVVNSGDRVQATAAALTALGKALLALGAPAGVPVRVFARQE